MTHIEKFITEDKVKDVYSKFTFEEVWEFINPDNMVFEIRMAEMKKSKEEIEQEKETGIKPKRIFHPAILGKALNVPYHWTGVFVTTVEEFRKACVYGIKNKLTMYLSAQPKKKSFHSKDNKFPKFNGEMQSEVGFYNILLDFDPTKKAKQLGKSFDTAESAYCVAKKFLDEHPNIKKYMIVCSGNGVQVRIPLDCPIIFPKVEYDEFNQLILTEELETYHKLLKSSLREILEKYNTEMIDVDLSSLEVSRVGRLPFSINWKKYKVDGTKKYAGVISIVDEGENTGLYGHIMNYYDITQHKISKTKGIQDRKILKEFEITVDSLRNSKLTRLLMTRNIPVGGRNNVLFFQWKLLLLNNGIDIRDPKVQNIIRDMRRIQNHSFIDNMPSKGNFFPTAITNWCIDNDFKPIYPVLYNRAKNHTIDNSLLKKTYEEIAKTEGDLKYLLEAGDTLVYRITNTLDKDKLVFSNYNLLILNIKNLLKRVRNTYGLKKLEYLIDNNILKDIIEKS